MADTANSPPGAHGADVADGKKWLSTAKIGVIVGAIVIFQCALAYHYLPGGDTAAKAEAKGEAAVPPAKKSDSETAANEHVQRREVDLGRFRLTAFDPNSNATLLIEFHLFGAVVADHSGTEHEGHGGKAGDVAENDNTTIGRLFKENKNRIRDQVIVIIRNAQISDLTDPGLGLIKRQILAKTNSLLGEPLLKEVLFSEFAVVRQ